MFVCSSEAYAALEGSVPTKLGTYQAGADLFESNLMDSRYLHPIHAVIIYTNCLLSWWELY